MRTRPPAPTSPRPGEETAQSFLFDLGLPALVEWEAARPLFPCAAPQLPLHPLGDFPS